jgi:hypothetical protein
MKEDSMAWPAFVVCVLAGPPAQILSAICDWPNGNAFLAQVACFDNVPL